MSKSHKAVIIYQSKNKKNIKFSFYIMCWISCNKPIRKVAEENIKVYKIMSEHYGDIYSAVVGMKWHIGEIESLNEKRICPCKEILHRNYMDEIVRSDVWVISYGFHSLKECPIPIISKKELVDTSYWKNITNGSGILNYHDDEYVYECVIPKGSVYYENKSGEIVSSKLKILNKHV